jgi:hypothetical protein
MPERHGEYPRHAENQRKSEKIPLLPKEIYICVSKKFHAAFNPFKIGRWSSVAGRSERAVGSKLANN